MDEVKLGKPSLIISVKEARKLLGSEAKDMTDEQVVQLIQNFTDIVGLFIQSVPKY